MKKNYMRLIVALLLATNLMAQNVPNYVPTNGLVGYWPFNGNANDESGNGNNGTVNGATLTPDRNGKANSAFSFDGKSNSIQVNNSNSLNPSQISISFWIYAKKNNVCVIEKGNVVNATEHGFSITHNDIWHIQRGLKTSFSTSNCSNTESNYTWGKNDEISNNIWNMVTVSIDLSGNIKHYLNDKLIYTLSSGVSLGKCDSPSSTLRFGGPHWNSDPEWFDGFIDDIAIYNRALTEQEITALYTGSTQSALASTKVFVDAPATVNQNQEVEMSIST